MQGNKINRVMVMLLLISTFGLQSTLAQNLNVPNSSGPMGIEVNTYTGNVFFGRTDAYVISRGININLTFHYNSYDYDKNIGFGNGWIMSYAMSYKTDTANNKIILWGDGREDKYKKNGPDFISPTGIFTKLEQYQTGKYKLTEPSGFIYYFDDATYGKLTKMVEPNGNALNFSYTDSLLTTIATSSGQSITLAYNGNGNLQSITDALTSPVQTTTYSYDGSKNLIQVNDPLGGKVKYAYLVNGPMKSVTDKNNNVVDIIYYGDYSCSELIGCNKRQSFSYDTATLTTTLTDYMESGNNQVTKYSFKKNNGLTWLSKLTSNCCGYNMNFTYDQQGNKIGQTDANGNLTTYTYDNSGNVLTITDALNQTVTYTYTIPYNNVASFTDEKGNATTMTYDIKGNLTQMTEPGGLIYSTTYAPNGDLLTSTDPKGNTFTYTYDSYGNPQSVTGPNGYNAILSYNARGNLIATTDSRGNTSTLEYDILNRLKKITDPLTNNSNFTFDAAGNLISALNENSQPVQLQYDASNRPVKYTDALGNTSQFNYDAKDNLVSFKDPLGNLLSFQYDTRNRLSAIKDAMGNMTQLQYDLNGNLTGLNLPNGKTMQYTYDALNRLKSSTDNTGSLGSINYDAVGNITSMTDPNGANTYFQFDNKNRITGLTDALGNSITLAYDNNGNIISITDRNGKTSAYTYDNLNRITAIGDHLGGTITLGYDNEGNVVSLKDQNNNITSYTYDALNRVTKATFPDSKFITYTYDNLGNLLTTTRTDGSTISFGYDNINRLISKTLPGGETFTYTYDSLSRVKTATNNSGTVSFAYDALSRVTAETSNGRTVSYSYDVAGRTQSTTYPDGTVIAKNFDTRSRLISVMKNNSLLASYTYDLNNNVTQKTFANGVVTTSQYDANNRLIAYSPNDGVIQNATITYDKEGNKSAITRLNDNNKSEQFVYDNNYRLIDYKKGPQGSPLIHNTYTYDALGNRTAANLNGVVTNYTINNLNQLTASSGGSNIVYRYDDRGNLTYDGRYYKFYNSENQLVRESDSASNIIHYAYDALKRKIIRIQNGVTRSYTFDGIAAIDERDGGGTILNKTYRAGFLSPIANENGGNLFYYHNNDLRSVEAMTNTQGRTVEKYDYDIYGKMTIKDSSGNTLIGSKIGNRFGFTGQQFDTLTGSTSFYFRDYNPETGLFNQRDLIGYGDGMGMYQYVHNNPANGIDVLGLNDCDEEWDAAQWRNKGITETDAALSSFSTGLNALSKVVDFYHSLLKNQILNQALKQAGVTDLMTLFNDSKSMLESFKNEQAILGEAKTVEKLAKGFGKIFDKAGKVLGALNVALKAADLVNKLSSNGSTDDIAKSVIHLAQSTISTTLVGGLIFTVADAVSTKLTGKGALDYIYDEADMGSKRWGYESDDEFLNKYKDSPDYEKRKELWKKLKLRALQKQRDIIRNRDRKKDCPPVGGRGKQSNPNNANNSNGGNTTILQAPDPNAIIGPDGVPDKHWVSVKDRLPYTILYETDKSASAAAKHIRIVSPVVPKQDAATFQLGSFGFNNQTFTVPNDAVTYSRRLDCRDSLNLYVDMIAGYDVINQRFFWEFQSIDPITLLPTANPRLGYLLQQDSSKGNNGHGFVNFSVKPVANAATLDTISAYAKIVFDGNDTIPTNNHKNTIDAVAPTTHMNAVALNRSQPFTLSWTGTDDANGSGIAYYTVYVSNDQVNYSVLIPRMTSTDTALTLPSGGDYCFFVLATDRVGNTETLRQNEIVCASLGNTLPVNWLYFTGTNHDKDNLLKWGTAFEQNSKEFRLERSFDGNRFTQIAVVPAAGNSTSERNYEYTDRNIDQYNKNVFFYRLKQMDRDDRFKYSSVVRLNYQNNQFKQSIVYPNPTSGLITVVVGDKKLIGTEAYVFDESGRMLQKVKIAADAQSLDLGRFVNGVYIIKLSNKETLKVVKH